MILLQRRPPIPKPPPNFCIQFPNDPACNSANVPVDNGIWFVILVMMIISFKVLYGKKAKKNNSIW